MKHETTSDQKLRNVQSKVFEKLISFKRFPKLSAAANAGNGVNIIQLISFPP